MGPGRSAGSRLGTPRTNKRTKKMWLMLAGRR